ncbi:MAG: LysE family transporter [Candidatus Taylorbacteria bacterium]|nr:LysE family transporter [Candidatus Taylorbacteria bacterium]
MKIFRNGLITGLILQLAIGPVFFFIVNLVLQRTFFDGLAGVIAVTLVDYLYITLSIFGISKLLKNEKIKKIFGIISSIVLIFFGLIFINGVISHGLAISSVITSTNIFSSFAFVFILTISNPMTIIFFTSVFTAKAVEYKYEKRDILIFGLGTGFATFIFMGISVIVFSLIKENVPDMLIIVLNILVGCLLIGYGAVRLVKTLREDKSKVF